MAKILIVDDEAEILALLELFLSKKGHDVVKRNCGKDAVETVKSDTGNTFELAILDRRMPDMDGGVVLENIRKLGKKFPVILLTGSLGDQTKELPVDGFLMKPIDLNELNEKINEILFQS
jgi:two-component system OmpR family response regulator